MASDDAGRLHPDSWLVAAGRPIQAGAPLNVPPIPASNFAGGAGYARSDGTPTWRAIEDIVGGLESGHAVSFSSGMAAAAAVFSLLPGDSHVALPSDCYHGVARLADRGAERSRWTVTRIPTTDTDAWLEALDRPGLVWLETPSNPLLEVAELDMICGAARGADTIVAVDNTFPTPLGRQPLTAGADLVVHAATKAIGGHSDLLMGITVASAERLADELRDARAIEGATPGALEAYLAARGARTLALRHERSQATAADLANRLEGHPAVERVRYPGLPSHPGHEIAMRELQGGYGSVISFDVAGGATAADAVCSSVRLVHHATSLGGVESTLERRAAIAGQEHLPEGLIRLSVGIEDPDDLWRDLSHALDDSH